MFQERFNEILDLLDIKNNELARLSGLDRTYISHFKNGKRVPSPDSETAENLIDGIIRFADDHGKQDMLSEKTGG